MQIILIKLWSMQIWSLTLKATSEANELGLNLMKNKTEKNDRHSVSALFR